VESLELSFFKAIKAICLASGYRVAPLQKKNQRSSFVEGNHFLNA
jgi:hypothetical protein